MQENIFRWYLILQTVLVSFALPLRDFHLVLIEILNQYFYMNNDSHNMSNLRGVTHSDKTDNYRPTMQSPSALWSFIESFSLFWFYTPQPSCFGLVSPLSSVLLLDAAGSCSEKKV